jgi:hypothetical protein
MPTDDDDGPSLESFQPVVYHHLGGFRSVFPISTGPIDWIYLPEPPCRSTNQPTSSLAGLSWMEQQYQKRHLFAKLFSTLRA